MTPQQSFNDTYITVAEICDYLAVNKSTVTKWRERGLMPKAPIRVGGKLELYVRSDIASTLTELKIARCLKA